MDKPLIMWGTGGKKLSGKYGTWEGNEYELRRTTPNDDGTLTLVISGGDAPGPNWRTHDHRNQFPGPRFSHTRRVPADDVTNVHAVLATGELSPGREVEIVGEDADGNVAVVAGAEFSAEAKMDLIEQHGFHPFSESEPVSRQGVYGWLPADRVHNIKSAVRWRKDAG